MNRSFEQPVLGHQRANHRIIPRHHVVAADEDEAVVRVDVALVVLGQPDVILDLLVRRDPADEQEVHEPVVEHRLERRPLDRLRDARRVDRDREDAGRSEAERLELPAVVLGVAERQIDAADERRQLLAGRARRAGTAPGRTARRTPPASRCDTAARGRAPSDANASVIGDGSA